MKRRTRNAARAKEEIIKKSAPIFNTHGIAGTSMQMIVDATGYQMGGIYRHFSSKKDLATKSLAYNYESIIKPNLEFDKDLNAQEKLLSVISNYRKMLVNPNAIGGCPLLNTAIEVDDLDESIRVIVQQYVNDMTGIIAQIIKDGKTQGLIRQEVHEAQEAQYLFASFQGAIMLVKLMKDITIALNIYDNLEAYLKEKLFV